jgi:hypothetical protein
MIYPDCLKCRLDGIEKLAKYQPIVANKFHWWGQRVCEECRNELGAEKFTDWEAPK